MVVCLRPLRFHTRRHSTASTARLYLATCSLLAFFPSSFSFSSFFVLFFSSSSSSSFFFFASPLFRPASSRLHPVEAGWARVARHPRLPGETATLYPLRKRPSSIGPLEETLGQANLASLGPLLLRPRDASARDFIKDRGEDPATSL